MDYFDIQVNGYGGIDFNQDHLTADDLHTACRRLSADGVGGILATVITEHLPVMTGRIANLVALRERDEVARKMIAGIHVEGPFLSDSPGFRGAHPAEAMRDANEDDAQRLIDAGAGLVRLVTLAPERDPGMRCVRFLSGRSVTVAAGHTDASLADLNAAVDAGLTLFTHLGNGCPMKLDRHDNIVQRALSLGGRITPSFIADGVHVPDFALRNYLKIVGPSRCIVTTDAVTPAGLGPGRYRIARWDLVVGDDLVCRAPDGSHLVGSATTMRRTEQRLRNEIGLDDAQIRAVMCENPRRAIGLPVALEPQGLPCSN